MVNFALVGTRVQREKLLYLHVSYVIKYNQTDIHFEKLILLHPPQISLIQFHDFVRNMERQEKKKKLRLQHSWASLNENLAAEER